MSRTDAWMPLYIGDYLADTMHLDARGHGAYLLLLMHYWRNGPLPDDDKLLAGIARVSLRAWVKDIGPTIRGFFEASGGRLHQKRADAERTTALENSEKRRAAGKLGGEAKSARKHSVSTEGEPSNATVLPGGLPQQNPAPRERAVPSSSPREEDSALQAGGRAETPGAFAAERPAAERAPHIRLVTTHANDAAPPRNLLHSGPNARTLLFSDGLWLVRHMTGKPDAQARSMIGRLLRDTSDDAAIAYQIVRDAADLRPADPSAWIMAAGLQHSRPQSAARLDHDWSLPSLVSAEALADVEAVGL